MKKWPFEIGGIVEVIVTTFNRSTCWNVALLGLHGGETVTARTWGKTRTRENFSKGEDAYIHFVRDAVLFAEAALCIKEQKSPHVDGSYAWVKIETNSIGVGMARGTEWEDWDINIRESKILKREVPVVNRGYNAIVEATVIASRLRISKNREKDLQNIENLLKIVEKCGNMRDREAKGLVEKLVFEDFEEDEQRKKF
tara:strand:- start:313 stop:906 length:594 start_codon:yes stop_codon:yes gene_type:complete